MTTILSYLNLSIGLTQRIFINCLNIKMASPKKNESVLAVKSISPNPMGKLILPKGCSFYRSQPLRCSGIDRASTDRSSWMGELEFISWSGNRFNCFRPLHPPRSSLPRPFPGPIVPGPAHTEQYIGPSAIEIFDYLLTIPEKSCKPFSHNI